MTWYVNSECRRDKGKVWSIHLNLWSDRKENPRRHIGCYFWFKPPLDAAPEYEDLYEAAFPDAPAYTKQRFIDRIVLLTRVRGGNAVDFVSRDKLGTATYTVLEEGGRDRIQWAFAAYDEGVPMDDILA